MQTFLPYPNFTVSMMCLDQLRLGKQRVEARQILGALDGESGWARHPAVLMWHGHREALMLYGDCAIREWMRRGYNNTMHLLITDDPNRVTEAMRKIKMPSWLGRDDFHASHRSNLLRKDPEWYGQFGWTEPADLRYVWPSAGD